MDGEEGEVSVQGKEWGVLTASRGQILTGMERGTVSTTGRMGAGGEWVLLTKK